ncbi:hypothetical protein GmHk_18G052044 [Glycine max]|nr:hypothetical protein GmHk_18G052044 [Glycine max]
MSTPLAATPSRIFNASPRLLSRPSNKPPSVTVRSTTPRGHSPPSSLLPPLLRLLDDNNAAVKGTICTRSFSHHAENTNADEHDCFVVPFLSTIHLDENVYSGALNINPWRWMERENESILF